jgi:hypothetical protein
VSDLSTTSMLIGSVSRAAAFGRMAGPLGGSLTGIGSVGLGLVSVRELVRARERGRRLDAAHGIAWSLQGITGLSYALQAQAAWLKPFTRWSGIVGGTLQAGVGMYRLGSGLRNRSRERVVLGSLDVGAGACWAASSCALATPWTLGGFVALTAARMAYKNREDLKGAARHLGRGTRAACARATSAVRGCVARNRKRIRRVRDRITRWRAHVSQSSPESRLSRLWSLAQRKAPAPRRP